MAYECLPGSGTDKIELTSPDTFISGLSAMTWLGFIYVNAKNANGEDYCRWDGINSPIQLPSTASTAFRSNLWTSGSGLQTTNYPTMTVGTWEAYCHTWDGTTIQNYLNGTAGADSDTATGTISSSANPILFGQNGSDGELIDGKFCEYAWYNRVLTADEISEHGDFLSPMAIPRGRLFYFQGLNTMREWHGRTMVNTGADAVDHPRVRYRKRSRIFAVSAVVGGGGGQTTPILSYQQRSVSR